ncbi:hypothetical protein H5410_005591 [Solanum commersonii]|uniref:Uncharacterized protein n=1 Tax=Solanum commersonii TaxID=4109 RepID=A0A9J6A708_SOLCO|nr:hypothetical protein H5410_005591 [Solanum commersonii]
MSNQDQFSSNSESLLIEKSRQKKAKIETKHEEIYMISKLPYTLIIQILSLLSKCEYDRSDSSTVHKFISLTNNVLPLHISCFTIKKLSLNFVFRYDDGLSYFPIIENWFEHAVNKKLEDLRLNICYTVDPSVHDQPYSLPKFLCSSSSIINLNCKNCRILEDCVLNWTSLKNLMMEICFSGMNTLNK